MTITVQDAIGVMEALAPSRLAESWDNVGLQAGCLAWPADRIWVALDPLPEVVGAACDANVNLLITHHPLIFKPVSNIDFSSPLGTIVHLSATHRLSIYAAHTNLDSVRGGINDILSKKAGLTSLKVLGEEIDPGSGEGIGRIGELETAVDLRTFAETVRARLNLRRVRYVGNPERPVRRVAVCSGSGAGLISAAMAAGADLLLSGDFKYHDARDAENWGFGIVDIGHFASEHLVVNVLAERLGEAMAQSGYTVHIEACDLERDPFTDLTGA